MEAEAKRARRGHVPLVSAVIQTQALNEEDA